VSETKQQNANQKLAAQDRALAFYEAWILDFEWKCEDLPYWFWYVARVHRY